MADDQKFVAIFRVSETRPKRSFPLVEKAWVWFEHRSGSQSSTKMGTYIQWPFCVPDRQIGVISLAMYSWAPVAATGGNRDRTSIRTKADGRKFTINTS